MLLLVDAKEEELLISKEQESYITRNRASIIENLDSSGIFLDMLIEKNIISSQLYKQLQSCETDIERNSQLLDFILKCSEKKLNEFIKVVQEQNQTHLVQLFVTTGKVK